MLEIMNINIGKSLAPLTFEPSADFDQMIAVCRYEGTNADGFTVTKDFQVVIPLDAAKQTTLKTLLIWLRTQIVAQRI